LKGGLTLVQTQAITRHRTKEMTDMYSHFERSDFSKAKEVQEFLLGNDAEKPKGRTETALKEMTAPKEMKAVEGKKEQKQVLQFPASTRVTA